VLVVSPNLEGLQFSRCKRVAMVWEITRTDGVILRLTSHDVELEVLGNTYTPNAAPNPSALRREAGMKENDRDFRGVLSSSAITTEDLLAGRYDDAQIDERLVDWRYPWGGSFTYSRYWITKVSYDGEQFFASITGLARWLRPRFGDVFGRTCRFNLGDDNCQAVPASSSSVVVAGMADGEAKRIIRATTASLGTQADDFWNSGKVEFTSGANNGLKGEIKDYVDTNREIVLQLPMKFRVEIGDQFTITQGCNKTAQQCEDVHSNLDNFGGFQFIPTTDRVLRVTPNAS